MNHPVRPNPDPQKRAARPSRYRPLWLFLLKFALCYAAIELMLRGSTIPHDLRFLSAWVAAFLLGVLIDLGTRATKTGSAPVKTSNRNKR